MEEIQKKILHRNVLNVKEQIKENVSVIVATKYVDATIMQELFREGLTHFGENRVEAFLPKKEMLKNEAITWHFIGNLQTRKVKKVINEIDYFHALDRLKLAHEIEKHATKKIRCFLEVNVSGEESKHGFSRKELMDVLPTFETFQHIEVVGLMTMAPLEANDEEIREIFLTLASLQKEIQEKSLKNVSCDQLSMGMSGDYPIAMECGATFVRIGSAFFKDL